MRKLDLILLKVFLYELPILALYAISLGLFDLEQFSLVNVYARFWYDFGGCVIFGSWMIISIFLSSRLVTSTRFREYISSKVSFLKERDEREFLLTGKAARNTMLTTMAVLLLLFCLSCFQFSVYRVPPEQAVEGKDKVLTLDFHFELANDMPVENLQNGMAREDIISYKGLPVSTSTVILGLICWQIASYQCLIHKELK
ncbi:hypothetical protein [Anaeroarcus burkinensis]|uniref:hypothetical protein n=1 Tax=Anaeroarcus burkinensis TaxID=82376 RepID=UPI000406981A|nr:hypothetical protein [Anaeroarcus burkinensis]